MKKEHIFIYYFLFISILFSACNNGDDSEPDPALSNAELLTEGPWQGNEVQVSLSGTPIDPFVLADIDSDSTVNISSATLDLRDDNTFTATGLGVLLGEQEVNGTWILTESDNTTQLKLEGTNFTANPPEGLEGLFELNFSDTWTVEQLDQNNLIISNTTSALVSSEVISALLGFSFPQDITILSEVEVSYTR